jgi:hypothetical protein
MLPMSRATLWVDYQISFNTELLIFLTMATKGKHIIALSLLLVFSLNTVISSTCAISSLFHRFHHHATPKAQINHHSHDHNGTHDHTEQQEKSKENCCSKSVVQFYKIDKYVNESQVLLLASTIFSSFTYISDVRLSAVPVDRSLTDHIRRWRSPATIQDLRIVIQSFQI